MATFTNSAKIFAIEARNGVVARVRINTMSTSGKAGLKAFAVSQPGVANLALELGMFSKTVEQLLAAKVNHVMILVSSNTATRFFQAQAAIKAGASKEEAVQKVVDTIASWSSDTTGIAEALPEAVEAYFAIRESGLDITVSKMSTVHLWELDSQACKAAGIEDSAELNFVNSIDDTFGVRCLDQSYLTGKHKVVIVGSRYYVARDGLSGINARRLVGWNESEEEKARFVAANLPENVGVTAYQLLNEKLPHVAAEGEVEEDGADI